MPESPFPPAAAVAAYLRDSGGDDQDLSVEQQELAVRAWCAERGLVLSRLFIDMHQSGASTDNRAGFEQLIQYFRQKPRPPEAGLIIWKFSRFARNLNDAQFYKADLRRRGFIVHSMQDNVPGGLDGHFFEAALDWMNARYLKDLSEDVRRGLHHVVTQFGAVPGNPPRGFIRQEITIGTRVDGRPHVLHKWVPDPELVPIVRTAFEMRARGASYKEIHDRCRLFTRIGSYTTFFTNRLYMGELRYGPVTIPDYCPPMVPEPIWQAAQSVASMSIRKKGRTPGIIERHPRRVHSDYILSGLLTCARCGSPMNGDVVRPKHKKPNFYYSCSRRHAMRDCDMPIIPQELLEKAVLQECADHIITLAKLSEVREILISGSKDRRAALEMDRKRLIAQSAALAQQIAHLTDAIAEKGHSRALLDRLNALELEQGGILLQIASIEDQIAHAGALSTDQLQDLIDAVRPALQSAEKDQVRSALRSFIDHITIDRDEKTILGQIVFYVPDLPDGYAYEKSHRPFPLHTHKFSYTYSSNFRGSFSLTRR